ncbi:MATE family efflux transporter [Paenalkalicoccus suaedae]|uniref:Multidrug export protein MepA n=1 Tax=Paenalkalicoccus suaedae TaxID=2592382 RepID=A0A859FA73_9BACI|nr:MATE family efflux transporter [Paenalkalicoccus suaedae]QKS70153.1 MATE family efflux transporter [Paenalkalicoccus suaedae]
MDQQQQSKMLAEEPIPSLLKRMSIPAIVGMVVMVLYNVVDTIFISYFVGIEGVAAATIAGPVMMIMLAIAAALGIGGSSVISRRLGEKREGEANRVFNTVLSLIIIMGIVGVIAAFTVLEPLLVLFGATPDLMALALDYIFPITLGTIFFSFAFATNAMIRSEGNARFAMITMIIPSVINIILDPIFIAWLGMGVQGAAVATVISQGIVSIYVLYYYLAGRSSLRIILSEMIPRYNLSKEVFVVGLPAFVRQVSASVMMIAINAMLIRYGGEFYVGVFGIVQRVMMFTLMPMMGILQGMQPIVGYNYGANLYDRMREVILLALKVVTIYSIVVFAAIMLLPELLLRIFTADAAVIEAATDGMRIMFAAGILIGAQVISGGLYQSLGMAKPALILSMARQVLFLIPLVLILPQFFGVWGVWLAFPIADVLAFLLSVYFLYRDRGLFFKPREKSSAVKEAPSSG